MSGDNLLWTATTPSFVDWIHWSGNYSSNDSADSLLDSTLMNDEDKGPVPPKPTLPIDMTFNDGHVVSIATYSVLLAISVCGNVTVLCNLTGRKHVTNPRVSIMLIHLAIADLLVSIYSNGIHRFQWVLYKFKVQIPCENCYYTSSNVIHPIANFELRL